MIGWEYRQWIGRARRFLVVSLLVTAQAVAQSTSQPNPSLEEVVVTAANLNGVVQEKDSTSAFGIDKALVDTPRSVTAISDLLLDRYDIRTAYDFTAIVPGTYTGSYFGVPGSLNIRGTMADNYFNGFQEITNFATYPTPVDASSNVELVRGPPSPAYGAGQVSGYMNFIPKSALGATANFLSGPTGAVSATVGSYGQKEATLEGGIPLKLGNNDAGVYGFVKAGDSGSYYLGEHPRTQVGQLTFNTQLGSNWSLTATGQYIHSDGYLKDLGWNRVTQNLIDNDQYTSGSALTPIVQPGQPFITFADFQAATANSKSGIQQYVLPAYGIYAAPNQYTELNPATVHTVALSPRVTDVSPYDINRATTPILYVGLSGDLAQNGQLKLESFSQYLDALNYQSSGFATLFRTTVNEERISYLDKRHFDDTLFLQSLAGVSYRYTHAQSDQYLNSGVNVQDRWDLSQPITPDEIFNAVFSMPGFGGYQWDNAVTSRQSDIAAFLLEDALLFEHLDITAGVRSDNYSLKSDDAGTLVTKPGAVPVWSSESASPTSYSLSISGKNPWAVPYITYARSYSLNIDQGDAVDPSFLSAHNAIGVSTLREAGVKTSQFGGRLFAAVDLYRQQNEYVDIYDNSIDAQQSQGFEAELRYLATRQFGITGTITTQHVRQLAGGAGSGPFLVITPAQAGIAGAEGYGGMFESNAAHLGLGNGYALHTTPQFTSSLFATYDIGGRWGLTGGVIYNSWTGGSLPGSIRLPGYALVKAGAYASFEGVRADLYVDNALDRSYFIAEYDVDSNASVLPGIGREWHLKFSKAF
jgi:iron complex outermembrane receptor protein